MALIAQFQRGELPLFQLNFGTIILLPKKEDAIQIQQYRPIYLLNVSFNFLQRWQLTVFHRLHTKLLDQHNLHFSLGAISWRELWCFMKPSMKFIVIKLTVCYLKSILKRPMTRSNGLSFNKLCKCKVLIQLGVGGLMILFTKVVWGSG